MLLELSDSESEEHANALLENVIAQALEQGIIEDAVVAVSIAQSQALWHLREHIPLAQAEEGKNIKHDISVPISRIGEFIRVTDALLQQSFPDVPHGDASAISATATCTTTCRRPKILRATRCWRNKLESTAWYTTALNGLAARFRPNMGSAR